MARQWIEGDETAKEFLTRVLTERPFVPLLPPLHRIPLRAGNVVEIVGPSPSSKTRILIQAAINCILPKEWKGVNYGGLERLVMFVDLDCRFDVLSLSRSLKKRIVRANGNGVGHKLNKVDDSPSGSKDAHAEYDKELFSVSMRRFLYIRCYDSFEFLATLKTLQLQLQKEKEAHGTGVYLLMIDSIGAFYWMDRASPSIPPGSTNRRSLSLQSVSDTVVQEIQKILVVHPMLVLTTKAASLQEKFTTPMLLATQIGIQGSCLLRVSWTQGPLEIVLMFNCIGSICLQYGSPLFHTEYLCALQMILNMKSSPYIWRNGCCHPLIYQTNSQSMMTQGLASSGNLRDDAIHLLSTSQCE